MINWPKMIWYNCNGCNDIFYCIFVVVAVFYHWRYSVFAIPATDTIFAVSAMLADLILLPLLLFLLPSQHLLFHYILYFCCLHAQYYINHPFNSWLGISFTFDPDTSCGTTKPLQWKLHHPTLYSSHCFLCHHHNPPYPLSSLSP